MAEPARKAPVATAERAAVRKPRVWRRWALLAVALGWLALVLTATFAAPLIAPFGPNEQDAAALLQGPSAEHLLGTDNLGRDLLSRLLLGGRVTMTGVLLATTVAVVLGSLIGVTAGYLSGLVDSLLAAVADILMSIPVVVILVSIAAVTSRNVTVLMLTVGVLGSAGVFRVFRAATLELRQELFVTAARASGLSGFGILRRHILPRLGALVFIQAAVIASLALVTQVGLGFLNIDVAPPAPSWGNMVATASQTIYASVWPLVAPGLAIALTVLAFSLVGDIAQRTRTGHARQVGLGKVRRRASAPEPAKTDDGSRVLVLDGVSVSVPTADGGAVTLIDDVSIDVRPGEIVGLVGESGAGKSVTARTVLGVAAGDARVSGSIRYRGVELLGADERALAKVRGGEIAFVGQDPMVSLSPTIRVGAQLAEAVRTHRGVGRKRAAEIALDLLAQVRIPDPAAVAARYPHEISGGMAQRVVIALALAGEPSVIIADEPTTALDVSVQMQILDLLRSLREERSLAMVFVTHDWGVVADLCDRAVVMYAGQVVETAPVADLFRGSRHPYSAALREADPHLQQPGTRLRTIAGQVPAPGSWPTGCRFAGRCRHAADVCAAAPITLTAHEPGREVRCVRADEIGPGSD
ncbi:dipeptide/oligopeptide/nickel ABC transporter permease/ATP-binding protein [Actinocorallia sp. A-T 12471]|uniref:dipeptide/oligopeptide/nickel ABC transporter permease/ATP-binding protein n=1 Tax=Actinocorallia sp. A-T 12471 TaxID=3089813 RepID=UPI0029D3EE48|nr:dipeptide/oligopeptide/nickel ABC transporter permease/ATP-binding protein [Actinocorallia sp. A-T 12471]MDX6740214.1 dipeptide/oligopeptide/nickel ABC transporter permease/ATP-binding protein [Actinocorallia sp. A-T 12471]